MTTAKHHPGARNSVSLEFRATPKAAAQFCAAAQRAGRTVTLDDARDVLSDLLSTGSTLLGVTARSLCRYHLRPAALSDLASRWASGALDARGDHIRLDAQHLENSLRAGPGIFVVPQRVDVADAVVARAVWDADLLGPVVEITARPRAGATWLASQVARELGVELAPLPALMEAYRPTIILRCAAHLSLAAAQALSQAGAGSTWTLIATGHDAGPAIARGPLHRPLQPVSRLAW